MGGLKATVYFAINKAYIVKELCVQKDEVVNTCQGQCHLKETLNKQADEDQEHQLITEVQLPVFILQIPTSEILLDAGFVRTDLFQEYACSHPGRTPVPGHRPPPYAV